MNNMTGFIAGLLIGSVAVSTAQTITTGPSVSPVAASSTVALLPTCNAGAAGTMFLVTDALTPVALSTVTGGGAIKTLVVCTGSAWVVG